LLASLDSGSVALRLGELNAIDAYLKLKKIQPEVRVKIHVYHTELLARVPPMLAVQAALGAKKKLVMRVPLFARCRLSTVLQMVGVLFPNSYPRRVRVFAGGAWLGIVLRAIWTTGCVSGCEF
jgi:hypothetical protein